MPITTDHLHKLLAVNRKINSSLILEELLQIIMATAAEVMDTEAASLLLMDEATKELVFKVALGDKSKGLKELARIKTGEGIAGYVAQTGEPVIVNDTQKDGRFSQRFDNSTGFRSKAILAVPVRAKDQIIGVLEALNPKNRTEFTEEDLDLFSAFADQAAISIENARLHAETLKQEQAKQALKIAHQIQQNFLPDLERTDFGIDVAAKNIPALDVGGDFYDVINLDKSRVGILIGDVSGKGVPASLYMVRVISNYRFLAPRFHSASELLVALNQALTRDTRFGMFITLLYLIVDRKKKTLQYASAGHDAILRHRLGSKKSDVVKDSRSMPLGLDAETKYSHLSTRIREDEIFVLYTDGITEARDPSRGEYGLKRLKQALRGNHATAKDWIDYLMKGVKDFTQEAPQHDDMTLVVFKLRTPGTFPNVPGSGHWVI